MANKYLYRITFETRSLTTDVWVKGQVDREGPEDAGVVVAHVLPRERAKVNVGELRLNEVIRL